MRPLCQQAKIWRAGERRRANWLSAAANAPAWIAIALLCGCLIPSGGAVRAQVGDGGVREYLGPRSMPGAASPGLLQRTFPKGFYYVPFASYYDGQYADALKGFQDAARGSRKVPGPWLDSICHHAMLGECHYQLGQLHEALAEYTAALEVALAYPYWLDRVHFAEGIRPVGVGRYVRTPWGQSQRNPTLGRFSADSMFQEGEVNHTEPVTRGGVVQGAQLLRINVYEMVRAACLAMRRRHELMGTIGHHDPLNQRLIEMYAQTQREDWTGLLIETPLAFAYRAAGKGPQAQVILERCVTVGQFDHPFTSIVLLELGKLARETGNVADAARFFEEATYAAAQFDDAETIEEAFAELLSIERPLNGSYDLPSLGQAAQWAGERGLRKLRVMLITAEAELQAHLGQTAAAAGQLRQAEQLVGRRDLRTSRGGARLRSVQALVRYQQNEVDQGDALMAAAIPWQRHGSARQFQIALLGRLVGEQSISPRNALAIYRELLELPDAARWTRDPLDAITDWSTPQAEAFETWFRLAWDRQRAEESALLLEIADRARRHRFLASLELGGRPQSMRWLLSAPDEQLSPAMRLQRQDLLLRFPEYEQSRQRGEAIRQQFAVLIQEGDEQLKRTHVELLDQLAAHKRAERRLLRELSLRREPVGASFPLVLSTAEIQERLPTGQAILAFFDAGGETFGFLVGQQQYQTWRVGHSRDVHDGVAQLLKGWNLHYSRPFSTAELLSSDWKKRAAWLLPYLASGVQSDFVASTKIEELTIVPSGALWYLPFEALEFGAADKSQPLIAAVRVRYSPTAALAVAPGKPSAAQGSTTVILPQVGKREQEAASVATLAEFESAIPGVRGWRRPISEGAAVAATVSSRLIVLDDLSLDGQGDYDWSPLGASRGERETTLADWLALPWSAPRELIFPGFHTAAETPLKRGVKAADGQELFLSTMAMLGAGARTIVLARWRTDGVTARHEVREFAQELPFTLPADAWQRAALLCMQAPLDPLLERRLNYKSHEALPTGTHPFFWAAPLLIDVGVPDDDAHDDEDEPIAPAAAVRQGSP